MGKKKSKKKENQNLALIEQADRERKEKFMPSESSFFKPRNSQQQRLQQSIFDNDITIVSGAAGTGKTLISIQTLYRLFKKGDINSIKIVRLVAETHGEKIGAVPGSLLDKLRDFAGPIVDNLLNVIKETEVDYMLRHGQLEVIPVSRLRGRSFSYTGVIFEEAQNLNSEMIITCLTRIGEQSKFVMNGDPYQRDFGQRNGIEYAKKVCEDIEGVGVVEFSDKHIERHPLIKPILKNAYELEHYDRGKESKGAAA